MSAWLADLRSAVHLLLTQRRVSVIAVLTFALGIGVNVAIFSFANAIFLRPLPYPKADRIVYLYGTAEGDDRVAASYTDAADWRAQSRTLQSLALFADWRSLTLTGGGGAERVPTNFVTHEYLQILGARPAHGRFFTAQDDAPGGASLVVVLSHDLWTRRFGSDPKIAGKIIQLNDKPFTVIGVTEPEFRDFSTERLTDAYVPIVVAEPLFGKRQIERRTARWMFGLARLKPGATVDEAANEMRVIGSRLAQTYPDTNEGIGATAVSLNQFLFGDLRKPLRVLLIGAAFVLLIACVNVAKLLLVQAAARSADLAVRSAVGATRWAVARLLFTESLLLAIAGGLAGLLAGVVTIRLLLAFSSVAFPPFVKPGLDPRVLGISFAAMLAAGAIASLLPIFSQSRLSLREALDRQPRQGGMGARRQQFSLLVVLQIALATALLAGAGVMIRSFVALHTADLGFRPDGLFTAQIELSGAKYTEDDAKVRFVDPLVQRLRSVANVDGVHLWGAQPPGNAYRFLRMIPEEKPDVQEQVTGYRHSITPGTLERLRIPILAGRSLRNEDGRGAVPVAVISESMARAVWGERDVLGKRFKWRSLDPTTPWVTVVGIAGDAMMRGRLDVENLNEVYFSYAQFPTPEAFLFLSTPGDPNALATPLRQAIRSLDADLPVFDFMTLTERMNKEESERRFVMLLMALYAAMATLLAAVGIYGVQEYATRARVREIGIRMAMGAQRGSIFRLIVGDGLRLAVAGIVIGALVALLLSRLLEALVYETSPVDGVSFAAVLVFLFVVALIAAALPARRAAAANPADALRG